MNVARQLQVDLLQIADERLRRERLRLADKARRDFYTFFRHYAWPVLEPATKFVDNWHIHAMTDHLQAVTDGDISRLVINIPFRMLKSTLVSQAWPAWEWINYPHLQYLTGSYAKDLATRDAVNTRRIIDSPLYREAFGSSFHLTSDQNVKTRYENNKRGYRFVTSTDSSATGFGGNRLVVDDPISAKLADSETERAASIEWWRGTVATRFNNPGQDAAVIVMQRLHTEDLTGFVLSNQPGRWEHLVLPMRYESRRMVYMNGVQQEVATKDVVTKTGFVDPRTQEGELLCPARLNEQAVKDLESDLGQYHVNSQMQQRPDNRGGTIFARKDWRFYRALPEIDECVLSVDAAFKDTDTSDFVAIHVWGRKGANKYLLHRVRERMGFSATVRAILSVRANVKKCVATLIEDKANGSAVIDALKSKVPGLIAIQPEGGKTARAYAMQPEHEAGNIWLPDPAIEPTIEVFISEASSFPNVVNDDETDAMTQAINWYRSRERNMGIFNLYREEAEQIKADELQLGQPKNTSSITDLMGTYG